MDPTATWKVMLDPSVDIEERVEAAENLQGWLDNGGFLPTTGLHPGGDGSTAARTYVRRRINETIQDGITMRGGPK